jgi:PAS domain S-box-containing protein
MGLSVLLALFVAVLNSRRQRAEAMARDMTAELRSQTQALQASQQMLDVIVENIPAGVFVKDTQEFRYELVNRAWRQMHDRVGQPLIGKTVHEVFDQPLADHFAADDRQAFASGRVHVNEESRLRTPLGNERVLRTMKVSVRNEAGKTSHLLGISMDMTEQVSVRTAIKENAQLMQAVFDNVADGIITVDSEGRLQSINRSAELMFG